MAATVLIRRLTGAGPTATDITGANTRASTSDAPTPGTADPIPIPGAGTNYSYTVSTRLDATVTPAGTIDNLRWYTDAANGFGTGVTCTGETSTAYEQAAGTQGTTGELLNDTNMTNLDETVGADVFSFTSGAPNTVAGSIANPTTGQFGSLMLYQIAVGTSAGPGTTPTETFTWVYDET